MGRPPEAVARLNLRVADRGLLCGGPGRAVEAVVADLLDRDVLVLDDGHLRPTGTPGERTGLARMITETLAVTPMPLAELRDHVVGERAKHLTGRFRQLGVDGLVHAKRERLAQVGWGGLAFLQLGAVIVLSSTGSRLRDDDDVSIFQQGGAALLAALVLLVVPWALLGVRTARRLRDPRTALGHACSREVARRAGETLDLGSRVAAYGLAQPDAASRALLGDAVPAAWRVPRPRDRPDRDGHVGALTRQLLLLRFRPGVDDALRDG
ncbi:hypothetical protein [Actinokineospora auranticolor]|uniref:hypothetical protein n=1 Tax=Actinokineospora auranticolor TaxID=155976 RepID=UPI0011B01321|nr:hypothetical protein [Actinokineospora auranticolor]